jgi:ABC-2 type transport system permease protein
MKKIWIVLKNEFIKTVSRRAFLLTLILVPLIPALILGAISLFGGNETSGGGGIGSIFQPQPQANVSEGYIDQANIIKQLPESIGPDRLIAYDSEEAARQAIQAGTIQGYYLIQPDYVQTGSVKFVNSDFSPLSALENTSIIDTVIRYNLTGADPQKFAEYNNPIMVKYTDLAPNQVQRDQSSPLAFYIPYGVTMLMYGLILTSSSLMLTSVAKEKENRVMEILMSSIKPKQLLTGKILGLGLVGLLQMVVWLGSAFVMLRLGGQTLSIPPSLQLPPSLLAWGLIFFILGYLLYATIMAGVGALVPNVREATQATIYVILPMLVPLTMVGIIIEQPNATLPVILSLIPFTAPNTLLTRMAVGAVPLWQTLTAVILLVGTIVFLIRAVAGMFRAQVLLTGKKFSLGLYIRTLLGKEKETSEQASS